MSNKLAGLQSKWASGGCGIDVGEGKQVSNVGRSKGEGHVLATLSCMWAMHKGKETDEPCICLQEKRISWLWHSGQTQAKRTWAFAGGSKIGPVLPCFGPSWPVGSLLLGLRPVLGQTSWAPKMGLRFAWALGPIKAIIK